VGLAVLNDVLLVPCLRQNLFSWKSVAKRGFSMTGKDEDIKLQDREGKDVLWAKEVSGCHVIQLEEHIARFSSYEVWHQALGHPSMLNNAEIDNLYSDSCLIPKPAKNFRCHACALSKSTHHKPTEGTGYNNAIRRFELIHTDLSGKFSVPSIGKRNYYITFIDECTRYSAIVFLMKKSDATSAIKSFVRQIEKQYDAKIQRFRHDNGGEYVNDELRIQWNHLRVYATVCP